MCPQARENCHHNVFEGQLVGPEEPSLVGEYLNGHDFADNTTQAIRNDLRKFAAWFIEANQERFVVKRVTVRDVVDFRNHLHRDQRQAVSSINRCLVTIRRFLDHLVQKGYLSSNPARQVKELRRQQLAPKGLGRDEVRRLLREVELRGDLRASAIFHLLLYTGARVSDLVNLGVFAASEKNFFDFPMGRRDWVGISYQRATSGRRRAFPGSSRASSDRGGWTIRRRGVQAR